MVGMTRLKGGKFSRYRLHIDPYIKGVDAGEARPRKEMLRHQTNVGAEGTKRSRIGDAHQDASSHVREELSSRSRKEEEGGFQSTYNATGATEITPTAKGRRNEGGAKSSKARKVS